MENIHNEETRHGFTKFLRQNRFVFYYLFIYLFDRQRGRQMQRCISFLPNSRVCIRLETEAKNANQATSIRPGL